MRISSFIERAGLPTRIALALFVSLSAAGCGVSNPGGDTRGPAKDEDLGTSVAPLTAEDAISRATEWVTAKLLYCQSPNGASDTIDPACPSVCHRMANAEWDPYRSDCSGLVSWAWGLPAPGRTTAGFAPFQTDITHEIQASQLAPGDAVNNSDHVMLFKAWVTPGSKATFIEEPGCSANPNYAHEFTSTVTLNGTSITVAYNGMTFSAIRYGGLTATPPPCTANGVAGTCIDTSVCSTMPGYHATAGLCPGPTDEQCCTPTNGGSTTASSTHSASAATTSSGGQTTTSASGGQQTTTAGAGGATGAGGAGGASNANVVRSKGTCAMSVSTPSNTLLAIVGAAGLVLARRRRARATERRA